MNNPSLPRVIVILAGTLLAAAVLRGQAASAPSAAPTKPDEVVELSPFEVIATASRGYATTSALSASRIAVPITELSSSVIVINEKLIEDVMPVDIRDTLNLVSGVTHGNAGTGSQQQNIVSIRGYTFSGAQRDGIYDGTVGLSGGFDYALFERIEVVKGPSGILYGTHSPGGVINLVSKRPLPKPRTRISVQGGSYNSYRAEVDTSNFIDKGKKFGYRLSAAWSDTDGPVGFAADPKGGFQAYNPSLSFRSDNGWNVWAWSAIVRDHTSSQLTRAAHAFRTNAAGTTGAVMLDWVRRGPGSNVIHSYTASISDSYELGVSKSFVMGPVRLDARVIGRDFSNINDGSRVRGLPATGLVDEFVDANGARVGGDSRLIDFAVAQSRIAAFHRSIIRYDHTPLHVDGRVLAGDFNFGFKTGPASHNLLVYGSFEDTDRVQFDESYDILSTAKLTALGATVANNIVRVPLWPARPILTPRETVIQRTDRTFIRATVSSLGTTKSFGAIERLAFWENRAILVAGVRRTQLEADTVTTANNVSSKVPANDTSNTTSYGALVKVYKGEKGEASLFYNDNETFTPVFGVDTRLGPNFSKRFPNRVASNDEFGLKVDLLKSRVVATASVFKTTETNFLVRLNDETGSVTGIPGNGYNVPVGVRTTKGWDVDLNVAAFANTELILSYSDLDPKLESGKFAEAVPFETASISGRYEFAKGSLKGLSTMWIWTSWGRSALGSRTDWVIDGGDMHTAILGYSWKRWNVRLRVENVFNKLSAYPSSFETSVGVTKDRNYRLGLTYSL